MEFAGARVLITGASRGVGEALAREAARRGAIPALVARNAGTLDRLAAELGGTAHPADFADPSDLQSLIERVEATAGPIDVLVNNAGGVDATWFPESSAQAVSAMYQLNLLAPVELCRQALPRMLQRGRGHVVNVSSLGASTVLPGLVAYSSAKAGLSHFTAGLRADLRGLPIKTTLVELGLVPTDALTDAKQYGPAAASYRRLYRLHLLVDVPPESVARRVFDAVVRGRRHVTIPRRASVTAAFSHAPRKLVELVLTGVEHRA
jgi:uncharacterized protein